MGDHSKKSILCLTVLVYFWTCIVPLESRFLAIFRPRSRHTSTILPLDVWGLPLSELKHCYGFKEFDENFSVAAFNESSLKETFYLFVPTSLATVEEGQRLMAAASRCVLLHGLYELWANADNIHTAVETCTRMSSHMTKDDNFDVAAGVIGNPYITNEDLQRTVLSHFDPLFTTPGNDSVSISLVKDKDSDISTEVSTTLASYPSLSSPYSCPESVPILIPIRIYLDDLTGRCIVGRLLTAGPATPLAAGQGKRDALSMADRLRRSTSGVLGRLALHKLPHRTATAMEPELAILMANLAMGSIYTTPQDGSQDTFQHTPQHTFQNTPQHTFQNTPQDTFQNTPQHTFQDTHQDALSPTLSRPYRVLDPFCGCGTLLLAVAYQYQQQQQQRQTPTDIPNSPSTHPLIRPLQLLGADADPCLVGAGSKGVLGVRENFHAAGIVVDVTSLRHSSQSNNSDDNDNNCSSDSNSSSSSSSDSETNNRPRLSHLRTSHITGSRGTGTPPTQLTLHECLVQHLLPTLLHPPQPLSHPTNAPAVSSTPSISSTPISSAGGWSLLDAIVADPPYDMRERQRQQPPPQPPLSQSQPLHPQSSKKGEKEEERSEEFETIRERDSMNDENADSMKRESEVGLISSEVGRASSDRPESVVVSLLTLAAASLRPQGRVVFFYPHRHSRLTSGLTSMTMTSTTVPSVTSSNGPNNPTNNKIHKRKAFRDAMRQRQGLAQQQAQGLAQQQALGLAQQQAQGLAQDQPQERLNRTQEDVAPEPGNGLESGSGSGLEVPPELLALLRDPDPTVTTAKLRLVQAYRQVLSPTFSRWLCVIEKT